MASNLLGPDAIREAARAHAPRHGRLLRSARGGRILSAVMLPWFLVRAPKGFGIVTTTGRRSGKRRRKCIRAIRRRDRAYLVMLRPPALAAGRPDVVAAWVHNLRADPNVTLRLGSRTYRGTAREVTEPEELTIARTALCETVNLVDYGECDLHLKGLPSRAKITELHRYWFETGIPIAIDLEP